MIFVWLPWRCRVYVARLWRSSSLTFAWSTTCPHRPPTSFVPKFTLPVASSPTSAAARAGAPASPATPGSLPSEAARPSPGQPLTVADVATLYMALRGSDAALGSQRLIQALGALLIAAQQQPPAPPPAPPTDTLWWLGPLALLLLLLALHRENTFLDVATAAELLCTPLPGAATAMTATHSATGGGLSGGTVCIHSSTVFSLSSVMWGSREGDVPEISVHQGWPTT